MGGKKEECEGGREESQEGGGLSQHCRSQVPTLEHSGESQARGLVIWGNSHTKPQSQPEMPHNSLVASQTSLRGTFASGPPAKLPEVTLSVVVSGGKEGRC